MSMLGQDATLTDDYHWVAHLDDGRAYHEHDDQGVARGWASVPQEHVISLELIPQRDGLPDVRIPIMPTQRPALFRRRQFTISPAGVVSGDRSITVIGWESDLAAHYWAVAPDGTLIETDDATTIGAE